MRRNQKIANWAVPALVVAVGVIAFFVGGNNGKNQPAAAPSTVPSPATSTPYHQRTASQCEGGFNVVFDKNVSYNDRTAGINTKNVKVGKSQALDLAKHDPRYLFKLVKTSPLTERFPQLKDYRQLQGKGQDDGCYSVLGRDAYNTLQGMWYNPKTKFKSTNAPAYGSNSGTNPNGAPFMLPPGPLTGDPSAIKITYPNGQVVYILHRCGNVFVPGKQRVPNVPVKRPPTPTTPSTPTTPATPSVCVTPPPPEGGQGYIFNPITCRWEKHSCLDRNGQACGPNLPFQPPQLPGNDAQSTATQSVPGVSTEPSPNPTQPLNPSSPAPANSSGYNGGGTSNPAVSGTPTTVDTGSYTSPVPTPTW